MSDGARGGLLITGAAGYLGRVLLRRLARADAPFDPIVAHDLRATPEYARTSGVTHVTGDVRDPDLAELMRAHRVRAVAHLASVVTPPKRRDVELEYAVDVLGTENVLQCCLAAGARHIVVTSSGAAYGYHPDNRPWLTEDDPIRGHEHFAYARHKRLVEEMLARYRDEHPELRQLILRPGTILGADTDNQITALFDKPFVLGIRGADAPFVFIWDEDVAACIALGLREERTGAFNLAGDGALPMREIARRLRKPYLPLPASGLRAALAVLRRLGLTQYGPEQIDFLRYRPVLDNARLKAEFGYTPRKTSAEVFAFFLERRKNG